MKKEFPIIGDVCIDATHPAPYRFMTLGGPTLALWQDVVANAPAVWEAGRAALQEQFGAVELTIKKWHGLPVARAEIWVPESVEFWHKSVAWVRTQKDLPRTSFHYRKEEWQPVFRRPSQDATGRWQIQFLTDNNRTGKAASDRARLFKFINACHPELWFTRALADVSRDHPTDFRVIEKRDQSGWLLRVPTSNEGRAFFCPTGCQPLRPIGIKPADLGLSTEAA